MSKKLSLALLAVGALIWTGIDDAAAWPSVAPSREDQDAGRKVWRVPTRKARVANPVPRSDATLAAGKNVYTRECASCHGAGGRGDGENAAQVKGGVPALQDVQLAAQSDGALAYKISTGRDPMPGYRRLLQDEEIWQTVHYLRLIAPAPLTEPRFLASAEQRKGVSGVFAHYAATTRALASSDVAASKSSAERLARDTSVLGEADGVPGDQREAWLADLAALRKAADGLARITVLAEQRDSYAALSDAMLQLVADFGHAESGPLRLVQRSERGKTFTWLKLEASSDPYAGKGGQPAPTVRRLASQQVPQATPNKMSGE